MLFTIIIIIVVIIIALWQTIKDRVMDQVRSTLMWNTAPGSLMIMPKFSQSLGKFPFYWRHLGVGAVTNSSSQFTAVVYVTSRSSLSSASPLHRLLRALSRSSGLHKVCALRLGIFDTFTETSYFINGRDDDAVNWIWLTSHMCGFNRMYGEGKLRGKWITQVHLES